MDAAAFASAIEIWRKDRMKIKPIIIFLLLFSFITALPQTPCTNETAYRTMGKRITVEDDLAMADQTFPKSQLPALLTKSQKAIDLIQKATASPVGFETHSYRAIRGNPNISGGSVKFAASVGFFGYFCVPDTPDRIASKRGKVFLEEESETWIEVFFNSFGWLTNQKKSLSRDFLTVNDATIYEFPKQTSELEGFPLFSHDLFRAKSEVVLILSDDKFPFRFLSREEYLKARILNYEKEINKLQNSAHKLIAEYQGYIAKYNEMLAGMSPAEKQIPAVIRDYSAAVSKEKVFADEDKDGKRLAVIKKSFFNQNLPRHVVQFITVYWRWNDKNPAKDNLIRQFKQSFDFQELKRMLEK